jgi:hypothetical protein
MGSTLICALLRQISRATRNPVRAVVELASPLMRHDERVCSGELAHEPPRTDARAATGIDPGLAAAWGTPIGIVPAIGDPFADIAVHVVKAECIGRVAPDRRGPQAPSP